VLRLGKGSRGGKRYRPAEKKWCGLAPRRTSCSDELLFLAPEGPARGVETTADNVLLVKRVVNISPRPKVFLESGLSRSVELQTAV